ncbi:RNA polymerase sigma factor [Carboxylicivirga sp. N1Y90]|uniref:RNA polymerase sigma factor n=1 Tax=Carboxylicivirga fragile TaxID=3417571 RepID=UPI003D336840|nr:sigma-70 family RNA polymerase sigma factor [Marinilabiliaceae bacterium N1Y90]
MNKLIKDLKKKRTKAQYIVFDKYSSYLFKIAYRYLKDTHLAEEAVSQAFMNIFNKIDRSDIEEEVAFKAWARRITINQALMEIRKHLRFQDTIVLNEHTKEAPIQTDQQLHEEDIVNLVLKLPDGYRTVFNLYVIEGYKHSEIAEMLSISVGTSKSQLSKARKLLQNQILKNDNYYATNQ